MTPILFIKLLRDLKTTWGRTVMMVIAISLSLIAFSTMLYARSIVDSQQSINYASTNPASARITIEPGLASDQSEIITAIAKAEPGVIDATMRSILNVQIQQEDEERQLQLFIASPSDPLHIAKFKIEQGSWPPPPNGILMEQAVLRSLKLKVGNDIAITGPDGKIVQLKITGSVQDPSLAPGNYGYISSATLPLLGKPAVLNQLAVTVADQEGQTDPSRNRNTIVRTAANLADRLEAMPGIEIEQVSVPPPYEHPHQNISNALMTALLAFGALSLLLSTILIATMFNGLLAQQVSQIGIMKTIGASSSRILQLYLIMILLISALATALAFLPGMALGTALAQIVLTAALNMEVVNPVIPWWAYGTTIIVGIVLPLLMSLGPLVGASRKTVRDSLDYRGADSQGAAITRFYTWIGKLHSVDRIFLMALRNIFRRQARFLLSVGLLATAGAIFIGGLNTRAGFEAIPDTIINAQRWDVEVRLQEPASASELATTIRQVPGVSSTEAWNNVPTAIKYSEKTSVTSTYPDQGHGSLHLTAIPSKTSMFNPPPVPEGRWLLPDDTDAIVLPQAMRKTVPDVKVGDTIQLSIEERLTSWRVVGIAQELTGATNLYVPQAGFEQATGRPSQANVIRIVTDQHDPQSRTATAEAVKQALEKTGIRASTQTIDGVIASTEGHTGILIYLILLISAVIGVVGLVGLGSMMSTNVIERTREFGIMNAIGAPASTVRRLVVLEGILIALVSCIVATIPALLLTVAIGTGLGNLFFSAPLPFQVSVQAIIIWVAIVMGGAILATLTPAYRASRLTVREALTYL
jgi:putative ABC transport system permease protein